MAGDPDVAIRSGAVINGSAARAQRTGGGACGGRIVEVGSTVGPAARDIDVSSLRGSPWVD
jgi:hypothetical protein